MSEHQTSPPSPGDEKTGRAASEQSGTVRSSGRDERGGGRPPHGASRRRHSPPRRSESQTNATINMNELREVVELVSARGFTDFEFENADIRIRLRRELNPSPSAHASNASLSMAQQTTGQSIATTHIPQSITSTPGETTAQSSAQGALKADDLETIPSPIVGTFYRSPSPASEPFIRTGERVEPDTVVCIIEAMKLMNEIQAETSGVIEKIYVENGQPVEFGQPLFGVRKV